MVVFVLFNDHIPFLYRLTVEHIHDPILEVSSSRRLPEYLQYVFGEHTSGHRPFHRSRPRLRDKMLIV